MTQVPPYQPIFILPENSQRNTGKDAQRMNIQAAKLVAETVRTTLGPKGMDKMIVDSFGQVTVTNDGVTILKEMNLEHPAAKMVVEIAKTQEDEVGDGTTTAVILAGELLKQAESLLDQNIHPTVIAKGYRVASEKSLEILTKMSQSVELSDRLTLKNIAMTAMTGKGSENDKEHLADLIIKAVALLAQNNTSQSITRDSLQIEKKVGGRVQDTEFIKGLVIDKERVHSTMPTKVSEARIALIDAALEIQNTEHDAKIQISDPSKMQEFLDMEENMLKQLAKRITDTTANVVFCQRGIDDLLQYYLSQQGVYALRRVKKSDMQRLSQATGARIVSDTKSLTSKDLGSAGLVEEIKVDDEAMTYVRECKRPGVVTVLVRGGTDHIISEVKRALEDAIGDIAASLKNKRVVAGAGACEIELSRNLRLFANSLSGREQLAVLAFAQSIEIIPKTLAENAGLDPIDVVTTLKAAHDKGEKWAGINVFSGKVMDAYKQGVIEPVSIKTQAISSASELAVMMLRIDDVIVNESSKNSQNNSHMQDPSGM